MSEEKIIKPSDLEEIFKDKFSDYLKQRVKEYDFRYRDLTQEERDNWLLFILKTLNQKKNVVKASEYRLSAWEAGWGENLKAFVSSNDIKDLIPRYFGKHKVLRWKGDFIEPLNPDFEQNSLSIIQDWLFDKYFRDINSIYEFGCGTGHNLFRVHAVNQSAKLYGCDWVESSGKILDILNKNSFIPGVSFRKFNFFEPDLSFVLDRKSGVYTSAALEQIGSKFIPFIDFLIKNRPKICIHIEPIEELLDETNLLDQLSIAYFKKRNYLKGFLTYLRELEKKGKVVIHNAQRTYIGSLFIDGYSVVVWSPL